jgi:hypothetical protein
MISRRREALSRDARRHAAFGSPLGTSREHRIGALHSFPRHPAGTSGHDARHKTPSAAKRARSASGADESDRQGHPSDRGRWSSRRKTEGVLLLSRRETLDALSAPTHPPRGGRVNTDFNLSQKLQAVHSSRCVRDLGQVST